MHLNLTIDRFKCDSVRLECEATPPRSCLFPFMVRMTDDELLLS